MNYLVRHRTIYRYLQDVSTSRHLVHLRPRGTPTQKVTRHVLTITPQPAQRVRRKDFFGNGVEWLAMDEPHGTLEFLPKAKSTPKRQTSAIPCQCALGACADHAGTAGRRGGTRRRAICL